MVCPVILNQDKYTCSKDYERHTKAKDYERVSCISSVTEIALIFDQPFLELCPIREGPTP